MEKIDFKKKYKELYKASDKKVSYVNVPDFKYIMISGKGAPEDNPSFQEAIEALYSIAYTLKFMLKYNKDLQPSGYFEYVITPLEGLYWMEGKDFDSEAIDDWEWTMMIMMADYITNELIDKAKNEAKKKKELPGLKKMKFEKFSEGKAAQIMHIGPYNEVDRGMKTIFNDFSEKGYKFRGKCHELYFSDPRRVPPEKLKTLIRIPYE